MREIARICRRSEHTVRDWRREKFSIDLASLKALRANTKIDSPSYTVREPYSHAQAAGRIGGNAVMTKYGRVPVDEARRKEQWQKWWVKTGRRNPKIIKFLRAQPINIPKHSAALAEFCGILLGDGGMSERQVHITLCSYDEFEYALFVSALCEKLFGVRPTLTKLKKAAAYSLVVSRTNLVRWLGKSAGLGSGHKIRRQISIPAWIMSREPFCIACLRGLVDTDGSVFTHKYRVGGKLYRYQKLSFASMSEPLRTDVARILVEVGMKARVTQREVWVDSKEGVARYFSVVGSHNPKHLIRYRNSRRIQQTGEVAERSKAADC